MSGSFSHAGKEQWLVKVLLGTFSVCDLLVIKYLFLSSKQAHGSILCFCDVKAGILATTSLVNWLCVRQWQQGGVRVTVGPGKEEGTCCFLAASSSHELLEQYFAPEAAAVPSYSSSWIHFSVFPVFAGPASLHPWSVGTWPSPLLRVPRPSLEPLPFVPQPWSSCGLCNTWVHSLSLSPFCD